MKEPGAAQPENGHDYRNKGKSTCSPDNSPVSCSVSMNRNVKEGVCVCAVVNSVCTLQVYPPVRAALIKCNHRL